MASSALVFDILAKDRASNTFDKVGDSADRAGGKLDKLKKYGAAAAAGAGAIAAGVHLFNTGARLEQMGQKAATVFGSQLGSVQKWADETAHAMGLTTREATGLAANFGDLLVPMGFTRKAAADMATDVVGLSGALSQWSGGTKSSAEVSEVLAKAMLGERDGLKELGISISEADVQARLLKNGQDKLTGSALEQAKAQATQQLIFEKSTDAQNAFAKGGSPLLSAQAKIKASLFEVRDELAVKLLPAFAKGASFVAEKMLPAFARFSGWMQSEVVPVVKDLASEFSARLQPIIEKVGGFITTRLVPVFQQIADVVQTKVFPIVSGLAQFFVTQLVPAVLKIYANVATKLRPVFDQLVATFRAKVLPTVAKVLDKFEEWRPTIQKVILVVAKIIGKVLEFAATILAKVLPPAIRFTGWLIATLIPAIMTSIEWVAKIIGKVIWFGDKVLEAGGKVAQFAGKVKEKIGLAVGYVRGIPGKIIGAIGDLGRLLFDAGKAVIQGLIDGIGDKIGDLKNMLGSVTSLIPDIKGPLDKDKILLKPAGVAIMEGLIKGIESGKTPLTTALEKVTGYFQKWSDRLASVLSSRNSFASGFSSFTSSVFGQDFTDPETGASTATASSLVDAQKAERDKALRLKRDVARLLKMGLSKSLIRQLAESGESGIAQIHALAQGSAGQVQQLNALNAETQSALGTAGLSAGNALYGDQIADARAKKQAAAAIVDALKAWREKEDKNTQIVIKLEGRTLQMSLLELKRKSGKELGLA